MDYDKLEQIKGYLGLIVGWGEDRNLIKGSTPKAQLGKLMEEVGEVAEAILALSNILKTKENVNDILHRMSDGIGDSVVVATLLAAQYHAIDPKENLLLDPDYLMVADDFAASGRVAEGVSLSMIQAKRDLITSDITDVVNNLNGYSTYLLYSLGLIANRIGKGKSLEDNNGNQYLGALVFHLCTIAYEMGFPIEKCLSQAWNEIKDRKGKMVDGIFIRDTN